MPQKHEIQFEDLHGMPDGQAVEIDLDADTKGIRRVPADEAGADDDLTASGDDTSKKARAKPDDGGEAEDEKFSKKFKNRLGREQRAKKKAQDQSVADRKRADNAEARLSKIEKRISDSDVADMKRNLSDVEAQLETAIEKGDSKAQLSLTRKMTGIQADLRVNKRAAEIMEENDDGGERSSGNKPPATNEHADDWMDGHSDWYGMKGFERQTRLANRLDKEVYSEGYMPDTEEYFEELDRRLKGKAPELFAEEEKTPPRKRNRGEHTVASTGSGEDRVLSSATTGLGSKVILTARDFEVMETFGIDKDDPEALKEFARNKREIAVQEEADKR